MKVNKLRDNSAKRLLTLLDFDSFFVESHLDKVALDIVPVVALQHDKAVFCSPAASKSALQFLDDALHVALLWVDAFNEGSGL